MSEANSDEEDRLVLVCHSCSLSTSQSLHIRKRTICPHCGHLYSPVHQPFTASHPHHLSSSSNLSSTSSPSVFMSSQTRASALLSRDDASDVRTSLDIFPSTSEANRNGNNLVRSHVHRRREPDHDKRFPKIDNQKDSRTSGPFQSITNFFKKLGPKNSKKRQKNRTLKPSTSPPSSFSHLQPVNLFQLPPISSHRDLSSQSPRLRMVCSNGDVSKQEGVVEDMKNEVDLEDLISKSVSDLEQDVEKASLDQDWAEVKSYYTTIFGVSPFLVKAVKLKDPSEESETKSYKTIDYDKVQEIYRILTTLPTEVQKETMKAIMQNLLKDQRIQTKDELKAYAIFLLNPQFVSASSYVLFAHLLRQISVLKDSQHHYIVNCFQRVSKSNFKSVVDKIQKFLTYRLFPPSNHTTPPFHKTTWWIPSATKVIALLNASSNLSNQPILSYQDFYNHSLDNLDLLAEYVNWQNNRQNKFTFCQYPFILSLAAKRCILQKDSEHQMVLMARRSLANKVQQRQLPEIGELFLNLTVRRNHLVSDSMNQISERKSELKKKLKVTFVGEPGLDMGGLTKEWFMLLTRHILLPDFGLFKYIKESHVYWFSSGPCDNLQEFNLVGVLMGLAVYNGVILDLRFPPIVYRKLLSPAVVPCEIGKTAVGRIKPSISHLKQLHVDMANGFEELLKYDGDVEEDFGVTFGISYSELDSLINYDLIPNGKNIPVTNQNREEYVNLYLDFLLNQSVYKQFEAFYHGFHSVCASNALILLRSEEIEALVCGKSKFEVSELKAVAVYEGYEATSDTIVYFWEVATAMSRAHQRQLLSFVTGNDKVPVGGMKDMVFKIARIGNVKMLPVSHTCFNQLNLPDYRSKRTLKEKLLVAIQNAQGFGLE